MIKFVCRKYAVLRHEPVLKAGYPEGPEWRLIHRIADSKLNAMQQAFLRAVLAAQENTSLTALANAIERGDLAGAEAAIDWEKFGMERGVIQDTLRELVEESGSATAKALGKKLEVELRFDLLNPRAVEFIKRRTIELSGQVSEESKQAIRAIVQRAFEEGGHPYEQARRIRQYIGLTERQMRAVDNYWRRLAEEGERPVKRVNEMTENYAKRLLRDRAETIARTETMLASNEGQREAWRQAVDAGLIDPAEMEREWIVTEDDRTCPICLGMDGKRAAIDGAYEGGVTGPPLHVNCRCAEGLAKRRS